MTKLFTEKDVEEIKTGFENLKKILKDPEKKELLEIVLKNGFEKQIPDDVVAFENIRKALEINFDNYTTVVILNACNNFNKEYFTKLTEIGEQAGGHKLVLSYLQKIGSIYHPKCRNFWLKYNLAPMYDWRRINTDIGIRWGKLGIYKSIIAREDGKTFQFSGTSSTYFTLVHHFLRQINSACDTIGNEPVLGTAPQEQVEEIQKLVETLLKKYKDLEQLDSALKLQDEDSEEE